MHPVKAHLASDLLSRHSLSSCVPLQGRPRPGFCQPYHVHLGRGGLAARCSADSNPAAPATPSRYTEEHAQQVVLPVPSAEKGDPRVLHKGKGPLRLTKEALLAASPTARAAIFTGLYILAIGLALLVAPLSVFTLLFDQSSIAPVWLRVFGVLAMLFGFYYLGAAHGDITGRGLDSFYISTIVGRAFLCLAFTALVLLGKAQRQLILLAALNVFGAASMQRALNKKQQEQQQSSTP